MYHMCVYKYKYIQWSYTHAHVLYEYKDDKQQIYYKSKTREELRSWSRRRREMNKTPPESLAAMTVHQNLGCHNMVHAVVYTRLP